VPLVQATGRSLAQAAEALGIDRETLRARVQQAEIDGGWRDGLTTDERTVLARRRREVRKLKEEREVHREAAALVAAESAPR
jgi:transposase